MVETPKGVKVRTSIFVITRTHTFNIKHKTFCVRTCKVPLNVPIWLPDYRGNIVRVIVHTTSFVCSLHTTSNVTRYVTYWGTSLEELARKMRLTKIVDFTTTLNKNEKKNEKKTWYGFWVYHSLAAKGITLQVRMQKLLCLILKIWVPMITKIVVRTFAPLSVFTITPFKSKNVTMT